jgi:hypothetical protein
MAGVVNGVGCGDDGVVTMQGHALHGGEEIELKNEGRERTPECCCGTKSMLH